MVRSKNFPVKLAANKDGNKNLPVKRKQVEKPCYSPPRRYDVLLGRGRGNNCHPGNRYFNELIVEFADYYNESTSRTIKSQASDMVVERIEERNGRFVKFDKRTGKLTQLDIDSAKVKITQALRYQYRKGASVVEPVSSSTTEDKTGRTTPLQLFAMSIFDVDMLTLEGKMLLTDDEIISKLGFDTEAAKAPVADTATECYPSAKRVSPNASVSPNSPRNAFQSLSLSDQANLKDDSKYNDEYYNDNMDVNETTQPLPYLAFEETLEQQHQHNASLFMRSIDYADFLTDALLNSAEV
jgi:hypothetical protein